MDRREEVRLSGAPRVAIDGRMLAWSHGAGVAVYAHTLVRCLRDGGFEGAVLSEGAERVSRLARWRRALGREARYARAVPGQGGEPPGWQAADLFREAQVFFNLHGRLMPVACDRPPAVMHWTYPVPLYMVGARNLYTVHDLVPLKAPQLTRIAPRRHRRLLRRIAEKADQIVAVSETVRAELIEAFGLARERVVNTYQAVEPQIPPAPARGGVLRPDGYFLFCGAAEPRKNLLRLVEAHALSGVSQPLVIVGPRVPGCERLEAKLRAAPGVVRIGWRPRAEIVSLIRGCRALLYPSLAEGFGLPIAEAMSFGAPVLTSARGACAEVAGEAGWLVDPEDVAQIAKGVRALACDAELRERLRAAGSVRAGLFTPEAYVARLGRLYARALQGRPGEGGVSGSVA
jgi:glycosyltransferase involved in cell wall biosynthesis